MERRGKLAIRLVLAVTLAAATVVVAPLHASAGGLPPTVQLVPTETAVEPGDVVHYTVHVQSNDPTDPITVTSIASVAVVCAPPTVTEIPAAGEADITTCTHVARASDTDISPYDASVSVSFEVWGPVESTTASVAVAFPDHGFSDVAVDDFYDHGVTWAAYFELVAGFNDGTFRGQDPVTRGQIVNMLWHMVDEPVVTTPHGFGDVPAGAFYRQALNWAKARNLVTGFSGNRYRPGQPVTRGQLVNMVYKMLGSPSLGNGPGYNDVSAAFRTAARWVRQNDLLEDVAPGPQLHPTQNATRGEVVYFLDEAAQEQRAWARWNKEPVSTWLFDDDNVSIVSRQFVLNRVTVFTGETVFWGNNDPELHTVTSNTAAWDQLDLVHNGSDFVTFDTAGTFLYHCTLHPAMTGRVTVQEPL